MTTIAYVIWIHMYISDWLTDWLQVVQAVVGWGYVDAAARVRVGCSRFVNGGRATVASRRNAQLLGEHVLHGYGGEKANALQEVLKAHGQPIGTLVQQIGHVVDLQEGRVDHFLRRKLVRLLQRLVEALRLAIARRILSDRDQSVNSTQMARQWEQKISTNMKNNSTK